MSLHDDTRDLTSGEPWDCLALGCDVCAITAAQQQPGESRAEWVARLRARFEGHALSGKYTSRPPSVRTWNAAELERLLAEIAEGRVA